LLALSTAAAWLTSALQLARRKRAKYKTGRRETTSEGSLFYVAIEMLDR
jgi:hypothetical protein